MTDKKNDKQGQSKRSSGRFIPRMIQDSDGTPTEGGRSEQTRTSGGRRRRSSNQQSGRRSSGQKQNQADKKSDDKRQARGKQQQANKPQQRRQPKKQENQGQDSQQGKQQAQGQRRRRQRSKQGQGQGQGQRQGGQNYRQKSRSQNQRPASSFKGAQQSQGDQPNVSPQVLSLKEGSKGSRNFKNYRRGKSGTRQPQPQPQENTRNLSRNSLKVIPLGGLCEVGKNMTVLEYGNDMIIIDIGIGFPEESQPGIESVIQDYSYVIANKHKLRGIFLTHGHEDHIGALAHFFKQVKVHVKVYGTPLTAELVKLKMKDRGAGQYVQNVEVVRAGQTRKAGVFKVEFIHMNHSIADACALAIDTPVGKVVHSGDFKIDYTPIHGQPADLARLTELGNEGVLLLLCESTNIEREGFSMSEKTVGEAFEEHFDGADGRIFVATFSSNVSRIQQIITAAEKHNRKVALVGRSMLNVFEAANGLGYLKMKKDTLIELRYVDRYRPEQICIISTGSQGEPMSALTRMAFAEHRNVEIREGDTVIISATPIPGNEKPIYRVIDELYKRGAKVIYSAMAEVHVSGHGYSEEIKLMHQLTKPKYFIPVHGEYRMLYMHAEEANRMGQPWESI